MQMPIPDNTLPMMSGEGPFGGLEMGGMFTVLKVRKDQKPGDYKDPGWYKHPAGTVAYEWKGETPEPARSGSPGAPAGSASNKPADIEFNVRKPTGHGGHG
jgi:hypothetical protein